MQFFPYSTTYFILYVTANAEYIQAPSVQNMYSQVCKRWNKRDLSHATLICLDTTNRQSTRERHTHICLNDSQRTEKKQLLR